MRVSPSAFATSAFPRTHPRVAPICRWLSKMNVHARISRFTCLSACKSQPERFSVGSRLQRSLELFIQILCDSWATDVVWRRILTRAEVPHRPIGQCRHSFAVLALKQHKPLNWIQRPDGSSHAANAVETLLALDTDRRSFCGRNVFARERRGPGGRKSCPP